MKVTYANYVNEQLSWAFVAVYISMSHYL